MMSSDTRSRAPQEEPERVIRLENVHKTYLIGGDGIPALRGVSLDVHRGQFVAVYGTSGSGKSTLLSTIGTIDRHSKGDLYLFGVRVNERTTSDAELANIRLEHIGFVFQAFNLLPTLTAVQNVELPMVLAGRLSTTARRRRALDLLDQVGMSHRARNLPAQLSGGEQQRVTIARALSNEPSLLLLDEPTGDLDTRNTDLVMSLLLTLHAQSRITLVMVTHDVALRHYADRVVQMRDGKVVHDTPVLEATRARTRAALMEQLAERAADVPAAREEAGVGAVGPGVTAGLDAQGARADNVRPVTTSVRSPGHYAAVRSHLPANP